MAWRVRTQPLPGVIVRDPAVEQHGRHGLVFVCVCVCKGGVQQVSVERDHTAIA